MGTSGQYGGPGSGTSLVPTWLEPSSSTSTPTGGGGAAPVGAPTNGGGAGGVPGAPPPRPPAEVSAVADRFAAARGNFSRFAGGGTGGGRSLGRAVSQFVSKSSGGAGRAARRMGASRVAGAGLAGFLADVRANGTREALRTLNLEALAGRSIQEIFLGLADCVCPSGGSVDEGIARAAFVETIVDLADMGVTDLDALSVDQMQTVFEHYATHVIEARICNDIGANLLTVPADVRAAEQVQAQLHDFIGRAVSDALSGARTAFGTLTQDRVLAFVDGVYESAFSILEALGKDEGELS